MNMSGGRGHHRLASIPLLLLAIVSLSSPARAQEKGEIRGTVTSLRNGETLPRASVQIEGTTLGAYADLNGLFSIRNVPAGTYTLRVKYPGHEASEIPNVRVDGGVAVVNVALRPSAGTVVVKTAQRSSGTEAALLAQRKKAANVSDGISREQMSRLPDATGADALARVTGLSVVGSRYAQIRGTSERYNNTQLNGVTLVSTDPGKRSFSFDLVPSNLLENSVVVKSFTPDLPGDFSGGLVQMNTIDFPTSASLGLSLSSSYTSGTTFSDLTMGPRSSGDWLASDDGLRALPAGLPDTGRITRQAYTAEERAAYARLFPNNYRLQRVTPAPGLSMNLSYGDRFNVLENDFGLIAALSYRNGYDNNEIRRYDSVRFDYTGSECSYSSQWGGILNLTYKVGDFNTISVKNLYNRTAEDNFTSVQGLLKSSELDNRPYTFQYLERSFYSGQVMGDHLIGPLGDLRLQWRGFAALGERNEPDLRRISFGRSFEDTTQPYRAPISPTLVNAYGAGRLYSNLDEELFGGAVDLGYPIGDLRLKVGGLAENRLRYFDARSFAYMVDFKGLGIATSDIDTLFEPNHFADSLLTIVETTERSDSYSGASHLKAGYLMIDLPFEVADLRFRTIVGARYEDMRTIINTVDPNGAPLQVNYATYDWLPSLNLIYEVTPAINLRLAYSRTVGRPDFREYARYVFYDFILDALHYGNPDLKRTLVTNYDARVEFFPEVGEIMAVSFFRKRMENAIEEIGLTGNSPERTWANADGTNTGIEFEFRKSLHFLSDALAPFGISFNYTWLDSKVDIDTTRFTTLATERSLQGQSPYLVNAGLYFDEPEWGTSVTVAYNRFGRRLVRVARTDEPDYYEESRDRVDITVSQAFLGTFDIKLAIKDLLAQDRTVTQYEDQKPARVDVAETSISLGLSARF